MVMVMRMTMAIAVDDNDTQSRQRGLDRALDCKGTKDLGHQIARVLEQYSARLAELWLVLKHKSTRQLEHQSTRALQQQRMADVDGDENDNGDFSGQ